MSITESIWTGIISGILTSLVLWFLYNFLYKKIFLPWLETLLYRSIIIEGKWSNRKEKKDKTGYEMILDVKQNGYKVKGTFFAGHRVEKSDACYYHFNGQIKDGYIMASYEIADREKIGMGELLLKLNEGGEALIGTIVFVAEDTMNITTFKEVKFSRL